MSQSEGVKIAEQFAEAIAAGEFSAAHALLAPGLAATVTPVALKQSFESMISYAPGPAVYVKSMIAHGHGPIKNWEVMTTLQDWPNKQIGDVSWIYVALLGTDFSEAVSMVVANSDTVLRIRELMWGRP